MKKNIKISIQQPCSEKFNNFTKTSSGGFCTSCSKEVIDFTQKSDKEVLEYFKNNSQKTCGNFYGKQLKTYSETRNSEELKKYNLISAFSFSLISLFFTNTLFAQKKNIDTITIEANKSINDTPTVTQTTVKGTVYSKNDNLPIPGVSIVLKNSVIGTETDFDGAFELKNLKRNDIISVYAIGYKTKEIVIAENQSFLNITLEEDSLILGGVIMVGKVNVNSTYKTKRSLIQRIKSIF